MASEFDYIFKYIIIGDSGVGKSCLLIRFTEDTFSSATENTIGVEFSAKTITLEDNTNVKLQIWDTAGQETFQSITRSYYRSAAGALLVYDVTCRNSFENVAKWIKNVREEGNDEMVICLVANKSDNELKYVIIINLRREVTPEEGKAVAEQNNLLFVESSAKYNINVDTPFHIIAEEIIRKIRSNIMGSSMMEFGIKEIGKPDSTTLRKAHIIDGEPEESLCKC